MHEGENLIFAPNNNNNVAELSLICNPFYEAARPYLLCETKVWTLSSVSDVYINYILYPNRNRINFGMIMIIPCDIPDCYHPNQAKS